MNCFAHAWRFLDRGPWFVTGTVLPDWLTLVARRTRVRARNARQLVDDPDVRLARLARGIIRHHHDDGWFHSSRAFVELNLQFTVELGDVLGSDGGFRPQLAGHIGIEMLLDGYLNEIHGSRLDQFYDLVRQINPDLLQSAVNRMAARPTSRIAPFVPRFVEEGYLYDYVEDSLVHYRLNRVLNHVGLAELPPAFLDWLATARQRVYERAEEMLTEPAGESPDAETLEPDPPIDHPERLL